MAGVAVIRAREAAEVCDGKGGEGGGGERGCGGGGGGEWEWWLGR